MQNKNLQMKRAMRTALFVLLLSTVGMGKGYAQTKVQSYDFSEVCPSGQTLWYKITDEANRYVTVVAPGNWSQGYAPSYWNGYQRPVGDLVVPEQVRGYTVIELSGRNMYEGDGAAFFSCSELTSVVLPNTLTSIGSFAFKNCTNLTSIRIPDSVIYIGEDAFSNCVSLASIVIPNSVTSLGYCYNWQGEIYNYGYIFSGCSSLASVVMSNSITYLGEGTFSGCSSLRSITIPVMVDTIGDKVFENCTNLQEVIYNAANCKYFGTPRFTGCSSLTTLVLGEQVQTIPDDAFSQCKFTGNLEIPGSVTTIGNNAFYKCNRLTGSLTIPNSVTFIGYGAFQNCNGFTDLTLGNSVTTIGASAFNGCCSSITSLILPNSLTSIGASAFYGFNGTFVTIPKSVAFIGNSAFGNCPRLTTVYYNAENATGSSGFSNCPNLTTIHIGSDVQEIHPIFRGCSSVHLVVALGPTPAVLESDALTDIAENSILMVSCGNKLNYFSVWNMFDFNNIMEDCGEYSISMNGVGVGGNVTASATNAQMGQEVQLTVSPNAGMMLSSISVCNATDPAQTIPVYPIGKGNKYGFIMPPFGVSVMATFTTGNSVGESNNVMASVYPNPTNGQVKIEAENLKHITISNMLGQTIYEGKANGDAFEYDFSKHETGIYLVRIETASGMAVKKVSVTQ